MYKVACPTSVNVDGFTDTAGLLATTGESVPERATVSGDPIWLVSVSIVVSESPLMIVRAVELAARARGVSDTVSC